MNFVPKMNRRSFVVGAASGAENVDLDSFYPSHHPPVS